MGGGGKFRQQGDCVRRLSTRSHLGALPTLLAERDGTHIDPYPGQGSQSVRNGAGPWRWGGGLLLNINLSQQEHGKLRFVDPFTHPSALTAPILESRDDTRAAFSAPPRSQQGGTSGEGGSGASRVWTHTQLILQSFLQVSKNSGYSEAEVLDPDGFMEDDLIPACEVIGMLSCAVASHLFGAAGQLFA